MIWWAKFTAAAVSFGVLITIMIGFIWRWFNLKRRKDFADGGRSGASAEALFSWADNPSLVANAVEHGWSGFAFADRVPTSSSTKSALLGLCVSGAGAGDDIRDRENGVEISWEVSHGSEDLMQKIGLNSDSTNAPSLSVIRTAMPFPGPPLANSSFPQEAYFEITILSCGKDEDDRSFSRGKEGERTKLIMENSNAETVSESIVHVTGKTLKELLDDYESETVNLSFGLTPGGPLPLKAPGTYSGSVGFNSNGSVFIDGKRLLYESKRAEWGRKGKIVGCGFEPTQRKVLFTVDSELVHEIHCKTEGFGFPLYLTLAANVSTTVLVNFGQALFKYVPANTRRTPNPCFAGPLLKSSTLGYEDSKELFSIGRIDAQWLNKCGTRTNDNKGIDFYEETEGDLFEIVLDGCGRSKNIVL